MKAKLITTIMITLLLASMLSVFVAPAAGISPPLGLVGRWHFDEGIGSTASDSSGNLNHGTLSGGKFGNALYFDGVGDYVEVLSDSSIAPPSITVEAWVKGTGPLGAYKYIISKYYMAASGGYSSYAFYTSSTGGLYFYVGTNTGYKISGNAGSSIWDGNWHHIAGTYDDSSEVLQFYVDGQRITNIDYGTNLNIVYDNGNLYFGNYRPVWLPYDSFKGYIDEVRISNTIKYIGASFTLPSAAFDVEPDTLGLWHFDESVSDKAHDETTNENDGTIYGAKWAGPTWTTNAKYGPYTVHFDGVDDYIKVPTSTSLEGVTTAVTVEAWVKVDDVRNAFYVRTPYDNGGRSYGIDRWDGKLRFYIYDGGTINSYHICEKPWTPTVDTWYHICGTFDGSTLKLYLDGSLFQSFSYVGDIDPSWLGIVMGARYSYGGADFHKGSLDEVRIYNVALAPEVIHAHSHLDYEPPTASAGGPYSGDEGSTIALTGSATDPEDGPLTYEWDLDNDDLFETAGQSVPFNCVDDGSYPVSLKVTDEYGLFDIDSTTVTVNNVAPTITSLLIEPALVAADGVVTANAEFSDPGTDDTHTASISWGDNGPQNLGGVSSPITATHTYAGPGIYEVSLTVTDDNGGSDTEVFQYVVVYDPSAGFVTGGGWIYSPPEAYVLDKTLEGKATFGFVSKYLKGANVPTGNTEFVFHVAGMKFKSTSYEWLVVAGTKAIFKGEGMVNGVGGYGFMLTAVDGSSDTFRIQIWDGTGIFYDNGALTPISGGSIVVHTK